MHPSHSPPTSLDLAKVRTFSQITEPCGDGLLGKFRRTVELLERELDFSERSPANSQHVRADALNLKRQSLAIETRNVRFAAEWLPDSR